MSHKRGSAKRKCVQTFVPRHEVRNFARAFATLDAKLAGNAKLTVVHTFVISGHGVRTLGPRKLRKCAERKVRAKIRTHFRKDCRETSFEFSFCRTSLLNVSLATWRQLKQQQRKNDTCKPDSCRYYKQFADRNSCFGGNFIWGSAISAELTK